MNKEAPPSYEEVQRMSNPHHVGPNPTSTNERPIGFHVPPNPDFGSPGAGQLYPTPHNIDAQVYPVAIHTTPIYVSSSRGRRSNPSVHVVGGGVPVVVIAGQQLGLLPTTVYCPTCRENVTTKTTTEPRALAWLTCSALFFLGCWMGCCLLPFCLDCCYKDVHHYCPRCNTFFGKYSTCD